MIRLLASGLKVTPQIFLVFSVVARSTAVQRSPRWPPHGPADRADCNLPRGCPHRRANRPAYGASPGMRTARAQGRCPTTASYARWMANTSGGAAG